jgi:hypothetical protein
MPDTPNSKRQSRGMISFERPKTGQVRPTGRNSVTMVQEMAPRAMEAGEVFPTISRLVRPRAMIPGQIPKISTT